MNTDKSKLNKWKSLIEQWRQSGQTQSEFCQKRDLKAHQLSYWIRRLDQASNQSTNVHPEKQNGFVQAKIIPEANKATGLVVRLPSGVEIIGMTQSDLPLLHVLMEEFV